MSSAGRRLVTNGRNASTAVESGVSSNVGTLPTSYMKKNFQQDAVTESQLSMAQVEEKLVYRFAMQSAARSLLPREGVAKCLRAGFPREDGTMAVDILYAPAKNAAHLAGLQSCKSVWLCPVCAAKISERRREDLAQGLASWLTFTTGERRRVMLVTFTLQHDAGDNLDLIFGALKKARRLLVSGRASVAFRDQWGITGSIRALELTHGVNGWHPHLHVLYFFDQEVPILPFEAAIKARWSECVKSAGRYASWEHGCDVRFSDSDISAYIAKWGADPSWTTAHEMTKGVSKAGRRKGRTASQLLADYLAGDKEAGRLWLQYAVNFKGERQLTWSKGLRDRLGLEVDKTDEEIAEEQPEIAVILASLTMGAWRVVLARDARAQLLAAAASGEPARVEAFIQSLGIGEASSYWSAL